MSRRKPLRPLQAAPTDPAAPGLSLAERADVLAALVPAGFNKGIFSVDEPGFSEAVANVYAARSLYIL